MSEAPLSLAPATEADHPELLAAYTGVVEAGGAFARRPPVDEKMFREAWLQDRTLVIVGRHGRRLAGSYNLAPAFSGEAAHIASAGFFVVPELRGRGFGRTLVEHSFAEARTLGFDAMLLRMVLASNLASRHLWRQMGFTEVGRIPRVIGFEAAFMYWREL